MRVRIRLLCVRQYIRTNRTGSRSSDRTQEPPHNPVSKVYVPVGNPFLIFIRYQRVRDTLDKASEHINRVPKIREFYILSVRSYGFHIVVRKLHGIIIIIGIEQFIEDHFLKDVLQLTFLYDIFFTSIYYI